MSLYREALRIKEIMVNDQRYLHQHPELGLELPETAKYVEEQLISMGCQPRRIGSSGIVADIGPENGRRFLLRADMDALPVREEAEVEHRSLNGNMHACGHDFHTAALLGAARLLKAHESELAGQVRLMFQPAEETMEGGKMMVAEGVTEGVEAALAMHVFAPMPMAPGTVMMIGKQGRMAAVDWFTIHITGRGCHGAAPHNGVDPLNVMSHIHLALQGINARELDPADHLVLTIGSMHGGTTANVIPGEARMDGTIRTLKNETRAMVKARMEAIVSTVAAAFGAEARVEYGSGCPVLQQDGAAYERIKGYLQQLEGLPVMDMDDSGSPMLAMNSEDFSYVASEVPSVFLGLAAGRAEDGYPYPHHHPKVRFHEDALPSAAAAHAFVATKWLKDKR